MGEQCREPDEPGFVIDGGGLDRRDLVGPEHFADDLEPAGKRGIAECSVAFSWERRAKGGRQGLRWVGEFGRWLGKGGRNGSDRFTGSVHARPPLATEAGQS